MGDTKVGRLIFYSAIINIAVKRGKCVVLATHQHQYIRDSRCILMSKGKIVHIGSFTDCVKVGKGKLHFVVNNTEFIEETGDNKYLEKVEDSKNKFSHVMSKNEKQSKSSKVTKTIRENDQEEVKMIGIVNKTTFFNYAKLMGSVWIAVVLLCLFAISQATVLVCIAAIGRWSETEDQESNPIQYFVFGLGSFAIFFAFLKSLLSFKVALRASKRLHDLMTKAVLRAKIEFFDTNPIGRILNRFSADVGSNDDRLPETLFDALECSFLVLGGILSAMVALPYILLILPPLIWYFVQVRGIFVKTSRELKRIEGLARSPIYAMVSESLSGVATIRANSLIEYFQKKFETCHDAHSRSVWAFLASSRWLGFRMDFMMFVYIFVGCFLSVTLSDQVDPVIFGLALSMLIQLGSFFQWSVRQSAEVVNLFVSVERLLEYSKLSSEAPLETEIDKKLMDWPKTGSVDVRNVQVRYRSTLPLSLKGVSFCIKGGQHVGIVGRTGSGKSTLVQALFRVLESENGSIIIDGVDISTMGLHKLRKQMSVINQTPVLFSGNTIRENLDPFKFFSDDDISEALCDVQMLEAVNELPQGLNFLVAESGSNFSVGERQLLCLARAILQKSKILVLDEPTANVDSRTEKLLQKAISKSFNGATIISVAHRLDTIIESDLILVLAEGKVIECGCPSDLIANDGSFASLVNDTGEEMSKELIRRSKSNK